MDGYFPETFPETFPGKKKKGKAESVSKKGKGRTSYLVVKYGGSACSRAYYERPWEGMEVFHPLYLPLLSVFFFFFFFVQWQEVEVEALPRVVWQT